MNMTEIIELPSKGILYDQKNPLSYGKIQLRYPTIKDQDILLTKKMLSNNTAIDRFLKQIMVDKTIDLDTMLVGDKNMLIIASRIMTHGPDYIFTQTCPLCQKKNKITYNLNLIRSKQIDFELLKSTGGIFQIELPKSKRTVIVKMLTSKDSKLISQQIDEYEMYKKRSIQGQKQQTDRLLQLQFKQRIISVDGKTDKEYIDNFVKNQFLSLDKRVINQMINRIQPGIQTVIKYSCTNPKCSQQTQVLLPITEQLFWPKGR